MGLGYSKGLQEYPPKVPPPRFRTLLGLIKPYIVPKSSLNPGGGVPLGGGVL